MQETKKKPASKLIPSAPETAAAARPKPRGFTLVELAIAMAILGLLISVALAPMRERLRAADLRETRQTLAEAGEAVVAYAIRYRTERLDLTNFPAANKLIAGRPYLPCPDVDGDGLEDRHEIINRRVNALTLSAGDGACMRNKGLLPWRTIGGPQSDKWGTHFTYRVDPNFSHRALGFDLQTRAETMDTLGYLEGRRGEGGRYPKRDTDELTGAPLSGGAHSPAVICVVHDCMLNAPDKIALGYTVADNDLDLGTFLADLKIGLVVTAEALRLSPQKVFERGDIVDAPAFVILSHGQNQLGGVRVDSDPSDSPGNVKQCVEMDDRVDDPHELQNAYYHFTAGDLHPFADPTNNTNCYTRATLPPNSPLSEAVFVDRPPAAGLVGDARNMDDVVWWMSPSELSRRLMTAGALPSEELGFLPE